MVAITAIAASTAVKTIHPSRDMFLNLPILYSFLFQQYKSLHSFFCTASVFAE